MEIVFLWIAFAVLVGVFASKRGRSGIVAFLLAILFSPLLIFVLYLVLGESARGRERRIIEEERIRANARERLN